MEGAVAETMDKLTNGTQAEQRRYSVALPLGSNNAKIDLKRQLSIEAIKVRNHTGAMRVSKTKYDKFSMYI